MHTTLADWLAAARDPARSEALDLSVAAATARCEAFGEDPAAVPAGPYCYFEMLRVGKDANGAPIMRTVYCPFWAANPDAPEQAYGYCAKLGTGDWVEGGTILLWDQCKECGVNDDADDDQLDAGGVP
jgi:hypothetical protein